MTSLRCGITEQHMTFTDRKGLSPDAYPVKLNDDTTNATNVCINWLRPYQRTVAPQKCQTLCITWSFYYASLLKGIIAQQDTNSPLPFELLRLGLKKKTLSWSKTSRVGGDFLGLKGNVSLNSKGAGGGGGGERETSFRTGLLGERSLRFRNVDVTRQCRSNSPRIYTGSRGVFTIHIFIYNHLKHRR